VLLLLKTKALWLAIMSAKAFFGMMQAEKNRFFIGHLVTKLFFKRKVLSKELFAHAKRNLLKNLKCVIQFQLRFPKLFFKKNHLKISG
jgi:hypothetical protein